ncbi:MAG TPA: hypothetical protein DF613_16690 [Lachnospiraceae bacterium]|nr:hypothetical protein [Lachnospiraceae bacterium]
MRRRKNGYKNTTGHFWLVAFTYSLSLLLQEILPWINVHPHYNEGNETVQTRFCCFPVKKTVL